MNLPSFKLRYLRKILQWPIDGFEITKEEARKGLEYLGPQKRSEKAKAWGRAARAEGAKKIAAKKLTRNEVRAAVEKRAGGICEACGMASLYPLRWDHWLGGSGRRVPKASIETTWMLCRCCDHDRTANAPSASLWNRAFKSHCERHGYPVLGHIEHKPLPGRGTA